MAGDNRPVSDDSRYFGAVPREAIDGRVTLDAG
jgi:type IV secretory pathway protease TraF